MFWTHQSHVAGTFFFCKLAQHAETSDKLNSEKKNVREKSNDAYSLVVNKSPDYDKPHSI